jgi:hypothetical protein
VENLVLSRHRQHGQVAVVVETLGEIGRLDIGG